MPVKSPPISLLRSSLLPVTSLSQMSLNLGRRHHNLATSAYAAPHRIIFSRAFPLRLRYFGSLGFSSFPPSYSKSHSKPLHRRGLSTRPFRSQIDSGSKRGNREPRSLVEEENELSDWVSGLRTNSLRSGAFTDGEDESRGGSGRGKKRGRRDVDDDGFGREASGYSGRGKVGMRRNKEGVSGARGIDADRNLGYPSSFSGLKNSRLNRKFGSDTEDDGRQEEARNVPRRSTGAYGGRTRGDKRDLGRVKGNTEARRGDRRVGRVSDSEEGAFFQEKGKSVSSFMDLIGEDDSDDVATDGDGDELESRSRSSLFGEGERRQSSHPPSSSNNGGSYLSQTRFDQCAISELTLKAIKDAGFEKMTVVQEATLPVILKGKDVMAKAKTGTGKTVAFLVPSIEVVVKTAPADRDQKRPPILVLVICPTRELATQAAAEANTLLKYHPSIGAQVVIGGTRLAVEQKRMQANFCQILIATPGRLKDHIENTAGFATRLMGVKVLVLDEADHLLDMGFRRDIEKIISAVPKQRQTLLFSATIPDEVRQICHIALKRDHEFVNTVEEGSDDTHAQVKQMHLVVPLAKQFPILYTILKDHISDDVNYKVLVFCTTAMVTKLVADLLGELNLNVREIHSRKPQSYRTRVSDEFRKSKGLILVTSDVSARGVDYPDVTLVIQLGLPADREQYIHRLGRTGRKGKEGQGLVILAPWEEFFLSSVKDLPISKAPMAPIDPDVEKKVEKALSFVEMKNKESAYQAWLGYYNSNKIVGRDKFRLVELANDFSRSMGLDCPPAIPKLVLGKMGLKNVPGLRSK